jgi:dipeptidyl aminopeptidase/acylaminoacyl peptidase
MIASRGEMVNMRGRACGSTLTSQRILGYKHDVVKAPLRSLLVSLMAMSIVAFSQGMGSAASPGANGSIAFVRQRAGKLPHVWVMASDGTGALRLGPTNARLTPTWSPDGTRIAYQDTDSAGDGELWVMNSDGTSTVALTRTLARSQLAWSPDGGRLAFTMFDDFARIGIADSVTGSISFSSAYYPRHREGDPAWAPGGHRIAYLRSEFRRTPDGPSSTEIFTMDPHGGHVTRLTNNWVSEWSPDWSPDGSRLLFIRERHDHSTDVAVMERSSGVVTLLTSSRRDESNAVFSPDGQKIIFDRCCFGPKRHGTRSLFVMDADGTNITRLTSGADDTDPSWQPLPG